MSGDLGRYMNILEKFSTKLYINALSPVVFSTPERVSENRKESGRECVRDGVPGCISREAGDEEEENEEKEEEKEEEDGGWKAVDVVPEGVKCKCFLSENYMI